MAARRVFALVIIMVSFRDQLDRLAGFNLIRREIRTKKWTNISIDNQRRESNKRQYYQELDQSAHVFCPSAFCQLCSIYIWPFRQDHVIHLKMSGIEQTTADGVRDGPRYRLKKTVVMVGMMGAGKTAVGRALAVKIGVDFMDSDLEIERAANRSVPEIFTRDGEVFFRKREAEVIARLLTSKCCVLSTGGGAFLSAQNRDAISRHGVSVWLNADLDLLWNRVRYKDTRPLLRTSDPKKTLTDLYNARVPIYQKADLSVPCVAKLSIDEMAERVVETLATRADVLERIND